MPGILNLISSRIDLTKSLALAAFAVALIGTGTAQAADTDSIANTSNVPVQGHFFACSQVPAAPGAAWTPSSFSFDISWVDPRLRAYFLADRSHNGVTAMSGGSGDVMVIDINNVDVAKADNPQLPDAGSPEGFYLLPPAADPMAGIRCDQNTNFGGTAGVGRDELTGPNGVFTVNDAEAWVGDGPSNGWQPTQFDSTPVLTNPNPPAITSCASPGAVCTYPGKASDYAADPCDSSVRVFDLISRQQTDHIDVGGCFRTDEGAFDPVDQVALLANPSEQPNFKIGVNGVKQAAFVTLISTRPQIGSTTTKNAHPILKQIFFDGKNGTVLADMGIEQAVYSRKTGYFYVSIPGTSSNPSGFVTVIDPRHDGDEDKDKGKGKDKDDIHVVTNFALTGGCAPAGAALGPDYELALFCGNAPQQVIDIRDGFLIKSITGTTGGCDEGAFNAGDDHFVGACGDSNASGTFNLDVSDADPVAFDVSIDTKTLGPHSVTADPITVSDWQPAAAGVGPNAGGLCGPTPCVLIFKSTGHDDQSAQQQEVAEDGKGH